MVRSLRAELGHDQGTVHRVATQLGYGVESVRLWVSQADIDDGKALGTTTADSRRIADLEQENRELRRANEILKWAATFSGRSSTASRAGSGVHRRQPRRGGGR
jgi:transposase